MQGKISGATSPKGLVAHVRAVFEGSLPPRHPFAQGGPTRPGHSDNSLMRNGLT